MVHSGGDFPSQKANMRAMMSPPMTNRVADAFEFLNDSNANLPVLPPINLSNQDPQKWELPNTLRSSASAPSESLLNGNPNNNAFVKAFQPAARPVNAGTPLIPESLFNPKKRLVRQQGQRNLIFGNAMANLRQKQAAQNAKPGWKRMLGFGGKSRRKTRRSRKTRKNRRS